MMRVIDEVVPRGLTREEAAAYVGLSPNSFDSARKTNHYPGPTLPGKRYDRKLLDKSMDLLSAIPVEGASSSVLTLQSWRESRGKRTG